MTHRVPALALRFSGLRQWEHLECPLTWSQKFHSLTGEDDPFVSFTILDSKTACLVALDLATSLLYILGWNGPRYLVTHVTLPQVFLSIHFGLIHGLLNKVSFRLWKWPDGNLQIISYDSLSWHLETCSKVLTTTVLLSLFAPSNKEHPAVRCLWPL